MLIVRGGVWLGLCRSVGGFLFVSFFSGLGPRMGWDGYGLYQMGLYEVMRFFLGWKSYVLGLGLHLAMVFLEFTVVETTYMEVLRRDMLGCE
jgi:hypothetical protein